MVCCKPIPWFVTVPDLEISIIFRISSVVYNLVRIPMNLRMWFLYWAEGGWAGAWARVGAGPGPGEWARVWAETEEHGWLVVMA